MRPFYAFSAMMLVYREEKRAQSVGVSNSGITNAGLSSWGALCQTQMGDPVLSHSLFPIPAVPLASRLTLKWGLVPIDMMKSAL